jgi:hypothetical protein
MVKSEVASHSIVGGSVSRRSFDRHEHEVDHRLLRRPHQCRGPEIDLAADE